MCVWLPMPAEPKFTVPGFALASAIKSFTLFAGTAGMHDDELRAARDVGHRDEVLLRIEGQLRVDMRIDRQGSRTPSAACSRPAAPWRRPRHRCCRRRLRDCRRRPAVPTARSGPSRVRAPRHRSHRRPRTARPSAPTGSARRPAPALAQPAASAKAAVSRTARACRLERCRQSITMSPESCSSDQRQREGEAAGNANAERGGDPVLAQPASTAGTRSPGSAARRSDAPRAARPGPIRRP